MTDHSQLPPPAAPAVQASDDRTVPVIAYALYLGGFATGFTPLIGVIIAHAGLAGASPFVRSHYEFLVRTFWIAVAALIAGALAMCVGFILSFVLIGIPIVWAAGAFMSLVGVWFAIRSVVGLVYVVQGRAYPNPRTWLI
ncbi:MAG: hypothetical protein ABW042_02200 [Phenylobacterium sp.]